MAAYLILQGVRRSVAAHVSGKPDIFAVIHRPGQPDVQARLPLIELFSPKPHVLRDHRYIRDTEYPTLVLGTEPPPITVTPIAQTTAARHTPLIRVALI